MAIVMYIKTALQFAPKPSPGGHESQRGPNSLPPLPNQCDDHDSLRAASGLVLSVFIGTLFWAMVVLALKERGFF